MVDREEQQAEAIASEWGIDVSLLDGVEWTIDTIDGNDGEVYGYIVNFDKGTNRNILSAIGLAPGEFTRRISLNAFDQPDDEEAYGHGPYGTAPRGDNTDDINDDDGIYSVEDPLPDISDFINEQELPELPPGEEYLTDETGEVLTDEQGNPLVVSVSTDSLSDAGQATAPPPDSLGKLNGAAFAGDAFAGYAFTVGDTVGESDNEISSEDAQPQAVAPDIVSSVDRQTASGLPITNFADSNFSNFAFSEAIEPTDFVAQRGEFETDHRGNRIDPGARIDPLEALRSDMLARMDEIESLLKRHLSPSPNRGHNHPPELLEIESQVTQAQLAELEAAVADIRREAQSALPNSAVVLAKASVLRRVGSWLADASGNAAVGLVAAVAYEHRAALSQAVFSAADAAITWAQHIPFQ